MSEPQIIGQNLVVDIQEAANSALGDTDLRSTTSNCLKSSTTKYRCENGRRYHDFHEDAYYLPNDEIEIERLDIQHQVWRLTLNGKLHISPLPDNVQRVVDIGTGTGQWAIEFAEEHPSIQVLGTDLSPIQPRRSPPNCSFLVYNAEDDWVFEHRFDFIHSRMLMMGIHDWPRYFKQIWDNLKPGGWMEVLEVQFPISYADDTVKPDSPLLVFSQHVREAAAKAGIDTVVTGQFKEHLQTQGFVKIRAEPVKWPLGTWPKGQKEKEMGKWTLENTKHFVSPIALLLFTKQLGWSTEEVEAYLVDVRKDLEDRDRHYYWQMQIFSAQKPETSD